MKQIFVLLCAMGLLFQSCHLGIAQDSLRTELIPELVQTSEHGVLEAGTPVFMHCYQPPLMKDIRTSQILIFKTTKAVLSKEGNILIPKGNNGIVRIIRIESKGRTAPDVVTLQLESVSTLDSQIISLQSQPIRVSVNLYDRDAQLFNKGFELSGVIPNDIKVQL